MKQWFEDRSPGLLLVGFAVYWLLQQPAVFFQTTPDEQGLFRAAVSLSEGRLNVEAMSSLLSVLAVPMVYLGKLFSVVFRDPIWLKFTVNSTNVILACLLLVVFYRLTRRFYPETHTLVLVGLLGAGTTINFYAVHFFNEILAALLMLAVFWLMVKGKESSRAVVLAGFLVSLSELNRVDGFLIVLPCLIYLLMEYPRQWKQFVLGGLAGAAVVVTCWWGLAGATPAAAYQGESLSNPLWLGLYGFLFSTGRSLFLYSPVVLLGVVGFPAFYRRHRSAAVFIGATVGIYLVLYSTFWNWLSLWGWGPRYLVKLIPLMMVPAGTVLYRAARSMAWSVGVTTLATVGVTVQWLSNAVNYQNALNVMLEVMDVAELSVVTNPYLSPLLWQIYEWRVADGVWGFWWQRGYPVTGWILVGLLFVMIILFMGTIGHRLKRVVRPVTALGVLLFCVLGVAVYQLEAGTHGVRRTVLMKEGTAGPWALVDQSTSGRIDYRGGGALSARKTVVWQGRLYIPNDFSYRFGLITNGTSRVYLDGESILTYQISRKGQGAQFVTTDPIDYEPGWHELTIIYKATGRPFFKFMYFPLQSYWQPPPVTYLAEPRDGSGSTFTSRPADKP
jgi:hypothetical protein